MVATVFINVKSDPLGKKFDEILEEITLTKYCFVSRGKKSATKQIACYLPAATNSEYDQMSSKNSHFEYIILKQ
jgi:ABC-type tungstate transport system permease subunit